MSLFLRGLSAGTVELPSTRVSENGKACPHALSEHQRASAASPETSLADLVGNFGDLESLFDQLGQPNVMELGKPQPQDKFMPKTRVGNCPAAHNQALLGDKRG